MDEDNTSYGWDDTFSSDFAALIEAQKELRSISAEAFMAEEAQPRGLPSSSSALIHDF